MLQIGENLELDLSFLYYLETAGAIADLYGGQLFMHVTWPDCPPVLQFASETEARAFLRKRLGL